jgi:hypothetical protein
MKSARAIAILDEKRRVSLALIKSIHYSAHIERRILTAKDFESIDAGVELIEAIDLAIDALTTRR